MFNYINNNIMNNKNKDNFWSFANKNPFLGFTIVSMVIIGVVGTVETICRCYKKNN